MSFIGGGRAVKNERLIILLLIIGIFCLLNFEKAFSQATEESEKVEEDGKAKLSLIASLEGEIRNTEGEPIQDAIVTINQIIDDKEVAREAVTNKDGKFRLKSLNPVLAEINYVAQGYSPITEHGVQINSGSDLSTTLREDKNIRSPWVLLILVPGAIALILAAIKEEVNKYRKRVKSDSSYSNPSSGETGEQQPDEEEHEKETQLENRFFVAAFNGVVWLIVLTMWAYRAPVDTEGQYKLYLLHPGLSFEIYIPILGFIGALLYVLDLYRKGREDIPKGTEFGMRVVMGPYIAIVMVVLFGRNLSFVDFANPAARALIAFFSGLLVVLFFQGIIERAQEFLGSWRRESRYVPTEIAKKFGLTVEEDKLLMKAGIRHFSQLRDTAEDKLREEVKKVGFDENLAASLKKKLEEEQLKNNIGQRVWKALGNINVKNLGDFSHVTDNALQDLVNTTPSIDLNDLKSLRDKAKILIA